VPCGSRSNAMTFSPGLDRFLPVPPLPRPAFFQALDALCEVRPAADA
jgi:hypothetical protein